MKDLLVVITPVSGEALEPAAMYALALGRSKGAHVSFLIAEIEPASTTPPIKPDSRHERSERTSLSTTQRIARTGELIETAAKRANVPCSVLQDQSGLFSLREILVTSAQVRDLTILGVHGPLHYPRQGLVEDILFGSGRPIVLVPSIAHPLDQRKVLIGWDATPSAVRAVHDALPLLTSAREVILMSVIDDKAFRAPHSGTDLCHYLRRWDVDAHFQTTKRGSTTVGAVLLGHARRMEAGLLVMGGFGHSRERELIFGSATRDIFKSDLEIPVLLSH